MWQNRFYFWLLSLEEKMTLCFVTQEKKSHDFADCVSYIWVNPAGAEVHFEKASVCRPLLPWCLPPLSKQSQGPGNISPSFQKCLKGKIYFHKEVKCWHRRLDALAFPIVTMGQREWWRYHSTYFLRKEELNIQHQFKTKHYLSMNTKGLLMSPTEMC